MSSVYLNGRIVSEDKALVSVFDRGLNYGDGLFETMKAREGRILFLPEHLKRLKKGLSFLRIPGKAAEGAGSLKSAVSTLLKRNGLASGEAYLRITVTRGIDRGSHLPSKGIVPTVIITAKPVDNKRIARLGSRGASAVLVSSPLPALPGVKTLNYLPNVLARMEAGRIGADEAIFVSSGKVLEGTSTNVFIVRRGAILTPPLGERPGEGVLPGVMRQAVIRAAKGLGYTVKERYFSIKELIGSDEAFITNSIIEVVPLVRAGVKLGSGRPGEVTGLIQEEVARLG